MFISREDAPAGELNRIARDILSRNEIRRAYHARQARNASLGARIHERGFY